MEAITIDDERQAVALGVAVGSVGLVSKRLTYDLEENLIEFTTTIFWGDNYRFTVHLVNPEFVGKVK